MTQGPSTGSRRRTPSSTASTCTRSFDRLRTRDSKSLDRLRTRTSRSLDRLTTRASQSGHPRPAAACVAVQQSGRRSSLDSRAVAYSAYDPSPIPNTSSPTLIRLTPSPIATTRPARSRPGHHPLRRAQPEHQPQQVRLAGQQVPRSLVHPGRLDPDQHPTRPGRRHRLLTHPPPAHVAVPRLPDRPHRRRQLIHRHHPPRACRPSRTKYDRGPASRSTIGDDPDLRRVRQGGREDAGLGGAT